MGVRQIVQSALQKTYARLFLQTHSLVLLHGFGSFRDQKLMWSICFILVLAWLNNANALPQEITISSTNPLNLQLSVKGYSNLQTGKDDIYLFPNGGLGRCAPNVFLLAEPTSSLSGGSPSGRPHIATGASSERVTAHSVLNTGLHYRVS